MYSIETLKKYNSPENIYITQHGRKRFEEKDISIDDVMSVIDNGEIIEEYPDDYPFPSCLILGSAVRSRYIHIVVSFSDEIIYLITAYYPDPDKWEADFRVRKR